MQSDLEGKYIFFTRCHPELLFANSEQRFFSVSINDDYHSYYDCDYHTTYLQFDLQQASGPRWLADFFWFSRNFPSILKLPILLTSARLLIEGDEEAGEQELLIQLFCNITLIQTELWTTIATPTVIYIIRLATGAGEKIVKIIIIIDIRRSVASIESRQKSGDAGMRIWLRCFGFFLWTFFAPTSLISESES